MSQATTRIEWAMGQTYDHRPRVAVYRYSVYGRGSVLRGQERKEYLDEFDTVEEAQRAFPAAEVDPQVRDLQ